MQRRPRLRHHGRYQNGRRKLSPAQDHALGCQIAEGHRDLKCKVPIRNATLLYLPYSSFYSPSWKHMAERIGVCRSNSMKKPLAFVCSCLALSALVILGASTYYTAFYGHGAFEAGNFHR